MRYFFFFQAKDGIRDLYVTGVQTCALPIFPVAVMTPTGMTKIVMTNTRKVVPTIIGSTPVVSGSKKSFLGIVEINLQDSPLHPLIRILPRITARMARMSRVARPVSPLKKKEPKSNRSDRK